MKDNTDSTRRTQGQARLQIPSACLPDDVVRCIIDEYLVPTLVQEFLRSKKSLSASEEEMHNGNRLL